MMNHTTVEAVDESVDPFAGCASVLAVREMTRIRETMPRPLYKLYGPNPSDEQRASHAAAMKVYNRAYRAAVKAWKAVR